MTDSTWTGSGSDVGHLTPVGDYNSGGEWTSGVPGPSGTAFFGASDVNDIFIENLLDVGSWHFLPGAAAYNFIVGGIPNLGAVAFHSAGIIVDGGSCHISNYYFVVFDGNNCSAGAAIIDNYYSLQFGNSSNSGTSTITTEPGAKTIFSGTAQAGNATITTLSGGITEFEDNANGGSAQFIADTGGTVDFSQSAGFLHTLTAGSIAGAGTFALGADTLYVGGNGLSTMVRGVITDGGLGGGAGAALHKLGTGTLTLSHTGNGYTGGTFLEAGTLDLAAVGAAGPGALTFNGVATLKLANAALSHRVFANPIDSFARHDVLDLTGLKFHAGATAIYHKAARNLTVHSGHVTDTLTLLSPLGAHFHAATDHHGGTDVFLVFG
jgi:autotransporter-associated beta strand protein